MDNFYKSDKEILILLVFNKNSNMSLSQRSTKVKQILNLIRIFMNKKHVLTAKINNAASSDFYIFKTPKT